MDGIKELDIAVIVPSGTTWHAEFAVSLIGLIGYFLNNKIQGYNKHNIRVVNIKSSLLPKSRLDGLKAAKAINATHLLYLDSDHSFPPYLLNRLLKWGKDIMAINCVTKSIPSTTTARFFNPDDPQGIPVYSDERLAGTIDKVWRVGTGVMVLSRKAYMQIPHAAFTVKYMPEADTYQGEDWTMCEALEKAGVPIYIDHGMSRQVGHVGNLNYTHDYIGQIVKEEV